MAASCEKSFVLGTAGFFSSPPLMSPPRRAALLADEYTAKVTSLFLACTKEILYFYTIEIKEVKIKQGRPGLPRRLRGTRSALLHDSFGCHPCRISDGGHWASLTARAFDRLSDGSEPSSGTWVILATTIFSSGGVVAGASSSRVSPPVQSLFLPIFSLSLCSPLAPTARGTFYSTPKVPCTQPLPRASRVKKSRLREAACVTP